MRFILLKKVQKIILYLLVFYAVLGFLVLPFVIKSQIVKIVEKETYAKLSVESVIFNPFTFKLKIKGVQLSTLENKPLVSLQAFIVDAELYSLLQSALHLKTFVLVNPKISLVVNADKSINFASLLKKSQDKEDENGTAFQIPRIILDRVAIVNGVVNYEDYTHPSKFDFFFSKIGLELKNVDTNDFDSSDATLQLHSLLSDGSFVDFKSEILGFKPLQIRGSLDFQASKLYTPWRYIQDTLNVEVADGKISLYTNYYLNLEDLNATTFYDTNVSLNNLRIKPKGKRKDIFQLGALYLKDGSIKPMTQEVYLKEIRLDTLYFKAKRDVAGNVDWKKYLQIKNNSSSKESSNTKQKKDSAPWNLDIDSLALQKIKVDFEDKGINPPVNTRVNEWNMYLQNFTLNGAEPFKYQIDTKINDTCRCNFDGDIKLSTLDVHTSLKCNSFDVTHYNSYIENTAQKELSVFDIRLANAFVNLAANVDVKKKNSQMLVKVEDASMKIDKLAINKKSTAEKLLGFDNFLVHGIRLDTDNKNLSIEKMALNSLSLFAIRDAKGNINIQNLIVPKLNKSDEAKKEEANKKEKEYRILLKHFALNSAKFSFDDKIFSPSVTSIIDKINFSASNIDSQEKSWLQYNLSLRVNGDGYTKASGSLSHTPLMQKGTLELNKISLKKITPYVEQKAFIKVDDGYFTMKGNTKYSKSTTVPDLRIDGSFNLEEFFVSDSRNNIPLASVSEVGLKSFTLEMFPNRLFIDEVNVNSFYVNAIIDKNKNINFSTLVKKSDSNQTVVQSADTNKTQEPFTVKIAKLNVAMGSARFIDLSLPLKFKTYIHDLNGVVYALSNLKEDTSYVDITGEIDQYGSTKLKGSINSGNPKAYTDLDFNFKNLELSSLSGYSASFAGHKINKGKLYLDLGYKVLDSELVGKNSILIKNIEVGEEVKTKNGNSLPLSLVIGLLEDNEGVIDIHMPVEGNVDKPNFKYGKLMRDTLSNLILKAATSPFKFLGSMLGEGNSDALEYIEFEPAKVDILPPEKEKLDNITKIMMQRPKISLFIAGSYNENLDKTALQKEKLLSLAVKKSGSINQENRESAMNIDLLEEIYKELKSDRKLEAIKSELKTKYKADVFERIYLSTLIEECTKIQIIPVDILRKLASKRARAIQEYLIGQRGVESSRVQLKEIGTAEKEDDKFVKTQLAIEVK